MEFVEKCSRVVSTWGMGSEQEKEDREDSRIEHVEGGRGNCRKSGRIFQAKQGREKLSVENACKLSDFLWKIDMVKEF